MGNHVITVLGATGKTGRHVAAQAVDEGWLVRSAGRTRAAHGEHTPFDYDDDTTWRPAFEGSDAAYVVIPFNHPGAPERAPAVLAAAADAGVGRIVLLSTIDVDHAPADDPTRIAEETLAALPVASAFVRPTWFLDNFTVGSFSGMLERGELRLPSEDSRIPFVDTRDIAAVAVAALAPNGPTGPLPVTGPESVDHHAVAEALSEALDKPVSYESVSAEEFTTLLMDRGFPRSYGEFLAEALIKVVDGRLVIPVADTVHRLTGRPPHSVDDFARHHAATSATR
ncbi:NAD(P)H-binding protein [Umezawaea sp. NPDC059074]|uniref:NmrA family NAD(P)-binding protein n=1 Tax=Umezawaea sp. NPDC059074 TaxID=3346716 RepID=UPI0036BCD9CC